VWLAAASTSERQAPPPDVFRRTAADAKVDELDAEVSRLHERLHPSSTPLQNRDLFSYTRRAAIAPAAEPARSAAMRESPPQIFDAPAPPLSLIGLAEEDGARTAIISRLRAAPHSRVAPKPCPLRPDRPNEFRPTPAWRTDAHKACHRSVDKAGRGNHP